MQRELTYHMPFERLMRLGRTAGRKLFPGMWWLLLLVVVLFTVAMVAIIVNDRELDHWFMDNLAITYGVQLLILSHFLILVVCVWLLRRWQISRIKNRVDYDEMVRMTQDDGGLRFATANVEHYLKWSGISEMLLEHDGVVVSHGILFFLIPDKAFASASDRLAFIREVYGRLGERARAMSDRHLRSALNEAAEQVVHVPAPATPPP